MSGDPRPVRPSTLIVLAVGTFALGIDGNIFGGLLPQVSHDLHVTVATAGQLTTVFAVVYAVASPVIAALAGSWDRRLLMTVGMGVFVLGMVLQAMGPGIVVVAAGRVVAALGAASYQATAYATAGLVSDDEHRPRALSIVTTGSAVSLVVGLPFGILIGQLAGWRAAMWVLVALAILAGAAVWRLPAVRAPQLPLSARLRVLRNPVALAVLAGTVTSLAPFFAITAFLPPLLGTGEGTIVLATLVIGVGQVVGTSVVPRLVRSRGPRAALVGGTALVTALALLLVVDRQRLPLALVTLGLLGFAGGIVVVPQQARLFTLIPRIAPIAVGLNGSAIYVASAIGAGVTGLTLQAAGPSAIAITATALAVLGLAVAVAVRPRAAEGQAGGGDDRSGSAGSTGPGSSPESASASNATPLPPPPSGPANR